jgi:signal transduction histidine kinase
MLIEVEEFIKDSDLGYEFAIENFIAHFSSDEQASVRLVFQTHEHNIKTDFGIAVPVQVEQEPDKTIEQQVSEWLTTASSSI